MAKNTDIALRGSVIYSVYLRAHTEEGTFLSLIPDLKRIHALGADIIWLMPIHPIGVKGKKGSLGCPYANRDYRTTNPCYGTMEEFRTLVDAIHAEGMKVMIDVVYNHTSPDSVLSVEHPEFFYRRSDGSFGNKVGEWSDVIDLDYTCPALWDYQIETLKMWAGIVDGFRCDVASCVPAAFWERARKEVAAVNPGCIWLAESVHELMTFFCRSDGIYAATDSELYSAFDMEYDYDIWALYEQYLKGKMPLSSWLNALNIQETAYPGNYIKLHCLENHDQPRIASYIRDERALRNLTALLFFLKGATLLYAGQEYRCEHLPSLFEKEVFERSEEKSIAPLLKKLAGIKKTALSVRDVCHAEADDENEIAVLLRGDGKTKKLGVFSLKGKAAEVNVRWKDGNYVNFISGETVSVKDGKLRTEGEPVLLAE